jgi:ADP-ribose pyrophosphatase YjhB (NUDIX family)
MKGKHSTGNSATGNNQLAKTVSLRMLNAYVNFGEINVTEYIKEQIFRTALKEYLRIYTPKNAQELIAFLESGENLFSRANSFGHITASSWILSADMKSVLLINHKKYNIWVAPGGHVDEGELPSEAAVRETAEEVGVNGLISLSEDIFDLDIHRIPASEKKNEPEHWHADVRYIFRVGDDASVDLNLDECNAYSWMGIEQLRLSGDESTKRMAEKTLKFIKN